MAFERRQPSVDLRAFLDPLKPGSYFDCGEARLHGIDGALEAEALRRGRLVGDDDFHLVATDGGLIFCRASISFAIAARWKDLNIGRPVGGEMEGTVLLPISWPTHGDLEFAVSRRLGSNVFRRWLQFQAQATRRSQVEQAADADHTRRSLGTTGDHGLDPSGQTTSADESTTGTALDLRQNGSAAIGLDGQEDHGRHAVDPSPAAGTIRFDEFDREGTPTVDDNLGSNGDQAEKQCPGESEPAPPARTGRSVLDEHLLESWVDDRKLDSPADPELGDDDPTSDPFERPRRLSNEVTGGAAPLYHEAVHAGLAGHRGADDESQPEFGRSAASQPGEEVAVDRGTDGPVSEWVEGPSPEEAYRDHNDAYHEGNGSDQAEFDVSATQFMSRTSEGTEVFPSDRPAYLDGPAGDRARSGNGAEVHNGVPIPEIRGARLQQPPSSPEKVARPPLDIRSTLLAGRQDSPLVDMLREHRVAILAGLSVFAILLMVVIGIVLGGDDPGTIDTAGTTLPAGTDEGATGDPASPTSTVDTVETEEPVVSTETTAAAPALRVTTTNVQICHSNYSGCVPVAADVDCEGDGDGPAFQAEPVSVFGDDVYNLDTDDDRQACEPDQPLAGEDSEG